MSKLASFNAKSGYYTVTIDNKAKLSICKRQTILHLDYSIGAFNRIIRFVLRLFSLFFKAAGVGVARTSLRDAARSLLPRSGTAKLSDHRRHRFYEYL
ncbi:hypothetical protein A6S26_03200 [Nostoc sp. ATCC 43529]|nr:hypothetical protein A6S26_03200 [Nostoc sp. ATCC 43529]